MMDKIYPKRKQEFVSLCSACLEIELGNVRFSDEIIFKSVAHKCEDKSCAKIEDCICHSLY